MALPFFREFGWEPLVLRVDPAQDFGFQDTEIGRTIPDYLQTWQAGCIPLSFTAWAGLRSGSIRSIFHLARLGDHIIRQEKPQAIFFSTTMFPVMTLGRYWHKRHGLPYVLDFQDPWRKERKAEAKNHKSESKAGCPPNFKARLADVVAGILEPFALRRAAHVVSVSPAYPVMLRNRYAWLGEKDFTVLPFGAAAADYEILRANPVRQNIFNPSDGRRHWVYVGACIPKMSFAVRAFFMALKKLFKQQPAMRKELRIHFIGTSYAPKEHATKTVEPLADEFGLGDIVSEITGRIPYFEALQCLLDADALFVPGSIDPGYTASKLYPYILARKPLLAVFHAQSSVVEILKNTKAGTVVAFGSGESVERVSERIVATNWLQTTNSEIPATDWKEFEPYSAREMTRKLCEVFDKTATGKVPNE